MTGVLLVNMGGATSEKEMKVFLSNMFRDPRILPFRKIFRNILSFMISNLRYKKSWKKYELIGGTPIIQATEKSLHSLQTELKKDYSVKMAFSYTSPTIEESMLSFKNEGIKAITVIPMYPHSSYSTTGSVMVEIERIQKDDESFDIQFKKEFYQHDEFIGFWSKLIKAHIQQNGLKAPSLLFSAHSIPEYMVNKGDSYPREIAESAALIAGNVGLEFEVAYQSGMSGKWIGPDTKISLKVLAHASKNEIVIIPISFVNENLETLYDIDKVIIPYALNELGIKHVSRVNIPEADELFIKLLADIVRN